MHFFSFIYFYDLIAHFFLALIKYPYSFGYFIYPIYLDTLFIHNLFIHSLAEIHLDFFQVLVVMSKTAINIHMHFCVDISFQLLWVNTKEQDYLIMW